ncbi:phosphatidate cytidylyltransferase [Advenella sp. RU8]|uniref:phosphatidate cytidylyltransferase n=1 Tax=Advenella sp. RU8 TaxID=3399575 RepID=UPI003AAFEE15
MLGQRVTTAIILLAVLIVAISIPNPVYFNCFVSLAAAAAFWEWLRLALPKEYRGKGVAYVGAIILFGLFLTGSILLPEKMSAGTKYFARFNEVGLFFIAISALVWLLIIPIVLYRARLEPDRNNFLHALFGFMTIVATWYAIITLYTIHGAWFVFSYLILIWCADIFAYFGGKYFGGAKLAPKISPGKTRSGALCGILASIIWLVASAFIENSFSYFIMQQSSILLVPLVGLLLAIYSIFGDLYESLMKRRAGFKDSSNLLPGHGGAWDRLDSVLSVSPIAMLIWYLLIH